MTQFPSRRGGYYYVDGEKLVSVTTALKVIAKPALMIWTAKKAIENIFMDPEKFDTADKALAAVSGDVDNAATAGSDAHSLAQVIGEAWRTKTSLLPGTGDDNPFKPSILNFFNTMRPEVLYTEQTVIHEGLGYAGTVDLIAKLQDGKTWIIDYKTGKAAYPDYGLQLTAYAMAEKLYTRVEITDGLGALFDAFKDTFDIMPQIDGVAVVLLRKDGRFGFIPMKFEPAEFLAVLTLWRWQNEGSS